MVDQQPTSEPIKKQPQSIREYYGEIMESVGGGENPYFRNAPQGAALANFVSNSAERPLFYLQDEKGVIKPWLTQADVEEIKRRQSGAEGLPAEDLCFDMFSLMIGGGKPTLAEIGAEKLVDLLPDEQEPGKPDLIRKILAFIDENPDTSLTKWLFRRIGLSFDVRTRYQTTVNGKPDGVIAVGDGCFARDQLFIWHKIRNLHAWPRGSPFKQDGDLRLDRPYDVMLGYTVNGRSRVTRLNHIVFLLARHGMSEEETQATKADQVYIPLSEYSNFFFSKDPVQRKAYYEEENENYIICNGLPGYEELQKKRKQAAIDKMTELLKKGELDEKSAAIDEYLAEKQRE